MHTFAVWDGVEASILGRIPCCRFLENGDLALFDAAGRQIPEFVASPQPRRGEWKLLSSSVSGGSYEVFLRDALAEYPDGVCLFLEKLSMRFSVPCPDGIGVPADAPTDGVYSPALCCNFRYEDAPPSMVLFDDAHSLREKYRIAMELGIAAIATELDEI